MKSTSNDLTVVEDDPFSFLFNSFNEQNELDDVSEIGTLLKKLGVIRDKYEQIYNETADEMENQELKFHDENAKKQEEYSEVLLKMEESIATGNETLRQIEMEKNKALNYIAHIKVFWETFRNRIDGIFDEINQNVRLENDEIVVVESDVDDSSAVGEENVHHELTKVQTVAVVESNDTEMADEHGAEIAQVKTNTVASDESFMTNDMNKENIRPLNSNPNANSTPIILSVATLASPTKVAAGPSNALAGPSNAVAGTSNVLAGPSNAVPVPSSSAEIVELKKSKLKNDDASIEAQPKKRFSCQLCDASFTKKTIYHTHLKEEHKKVPKSQKRKSNEMAGLMIRKTSSQKRKHYIIQDDELSGDEDEDYDDVEEDNASDDDGYFILPKSMKHLLKRQKKHGGKIVYMSK